MLLAALVWAPAAAAGSFGPDPSPDVRTLSPDPVPHATPAPARTLSQPIATVRTTVGSAPAAPAVPSIEARSAPRVKAKKAVAPAPKPAPKAKARPAAEPRRGVLDQAARIDQSIPRTLEAIADGTSPTLLAALGLFALVLASSSFLWLLHLRAEELR